MKRIASIDIGTNTFLLLIAEAKPNNELIVLYEAIEIARLGENVDKIGKISDLAVERANSILKDYVNICNKFDVNLILPVGTSALRDATNSCDVASTFSNTIGFPINIISGEKEAELSYLGTVENENSNIVIDIGGGSSEVIIGNKKGILYKKSLQIGAVRLTERYFKQTHPPSVNSITLAKKDILKQLSDFKSIEDIDTTYAVAGTATTLATTLLDLDDFEVERINGLEISFEQIESLFTMYYESSIQEIISKFKVHPKRADLILAGTLIMKTIMEQLALSKIKVSTRGLRYGILIDYIQKSLN
ncbi:Ppx/GppA phosphatase family protein [Candidatus Kapaibacterium sp.]